MSFPSIVAVLSGGDSLDAVRWAAWLSQHSGLPLDVVHAFHGTPAGVTLQKQHQSRERAKAKIWLQAALDESPALPYDLHLVVSEGSLEEIVDGRLGEGGVLVTGSHGPAELVAWGCRIRRCPVVIVPAAENASGKGMDGGARYTRLASVGVPA